MVATPCIGGGGDKVTDILGQLKKKSGNTTDTETVVPNCVI